MMSHRHNPSTIRTFSDNVPSVFVLRLIQYLKSLGIDDQG